MILLKLRDMWPKKSEAWAKAVAAGAVPLDDFNARFEHEIRETYKQ